MWQVYEFPIARHSCGMIPARPPTTATAIAWFEDTLRHNGIDGLPLRAYKFLSPKSDFFETNLRNAIVGSSLYLTPREAFNDPFDTTAACDLGMPEEQREFLKVLSERNGDGLHEDLSELEEMRSLFYKSGSFERLVQGNLGKIGICSLSAEIDNLLMWAHYADSHRGVALIFNMHNELAHLDALPVRYESHFSRISPSSRVIDELLLYGPLHKSANWKDEKEWRIVKPMKAGMQFPFHPSLLWGVIHGMRCEEPVIQLISKLCLERINTGESVLHLYEARPRPREYALDFYEVIPLKRLGPINFREPLPLPPEIIAG